MPRRNESSDHWVERLSSRHDLTTFTSSNDELTKYLREDALEDQCNRTALTHLLLTRSNGIVGYFTLLTDSMKLENVSPEWLLHDYPYRFLPALKIARLSTRQGMEGRGLGTAMLDLSFSYLFEVSRYAGCRVMAVDSKRGCEGFYEKYGFSRANRSGKDTVPMYLDVKAFFERKCAMTRSDV